MLDQWHGVQAYFWNASHLCFRMKISRKWKGSVAGFFIVFCCFLNIEPEVSVLELVISRAGQSKGLSVNTYKRQQIEDNM